jgi:alpha-tubulin suppressor-like RCC1 family protein
MDKNISSGKSPVTGKRKAIIAASIVAALAVIIIVAVHIGSQNKDFDFFVDKLTNVSSTYYGVDDAIKSWEKDYWPTAFHEVRDKGGFERKLNARIAELANAEDFRQLCITAKLLDLAGFDKPDTIAAMDKALNGCVNSAMETDAVKTFETYSSGIMKYITFLENVSLYPRASELLSAERVAEALRPDKEAALTSNSLTDCIEYAAIVSDISNQLNYIKAADLLTVDELLPVVLSNTAPALFENDRGGYYDSRHDEFKDSKKSEYLTAQKGILETVTTTYKFFGDFMVYEYSDKLTDSTGTADDYGKNSLRDASSSKSEFYYKGDSMGSYVTAFLDVVNNNNGEIHAVYASEKYIIIITDMGIFGVCGGSFELWYQFENGQLERIANEYKDVTEREQRSTYQQAEALLAAEDYEGAYALFLALADYKDSAERARIIAYELHVANGDNIVALAAGDSHTVGLKANGTVVAIGRNNYGQCNVSDWNDIIEIAVSSSHTVGLKADGTVVAVGNNDSKQCNVSAWTDIVSISAGDGIGASYGLTVGLKKDGTIVVAGYNEKYAAAMSKWRSIDAVSVGVYHRMGLKSDGTVVEVGENSSTFGVFDVSDWRDIIAISASGSFAVGLKTDGTVIMTGNDKSNIQSGVSEWHDIIAVSTGSSFAVGLNSDGTVVAVGSNEFGQCDVSDWRDIIAITAGGSYSVGLKADGTVVAVGKNEYGQCDVSDWDLW